jgi:uncharacterized protein
MLGWGVLIIFVLLTAFLLFLVGKIEHQSIFQPSYGEVWKPSVEYLEYEIKSQDHSLRVWEFRNFPSRNVILFCHGNNDNISYREYAINACEIYHLNLVLFDYRGFGSSEGKFSQENICQDALSVYHHLRKTYPPEKIVIWGESLGGAPATYTACKVPCRGLVLFATFSSLGDLADRSESFDTIRRVSLIGTKFLYDGLETLTWIRRVKCPVLIVHSIEDVLIPFSCAYDLFMAISHPNKQLIKIKGGHSSPSITVEQLDILYSFIDTDIKKNERKDKEVLIKDLQLVGRRINYQKKNFQAKDWLS